ncbi:MAG: tetratricopeptide repeat protein [Taibaiella sp.]|nr:tetratricopeptide repeat protein [Taibaiella sp.]
MAHLKLKAILLALLCTGAFSAIAQTGSAEIKNMIGQANQMADEDEYRQMMKSADSFARKVNNVEGQARVNQALAGHFYEKDADESIKYQQKAYRLLVTAGYKDEAASSLLNIATAYEEYKKDYDEALKFSKRALNAYVELKDTLGQANVHKYIGVLHGKMRNFDDAKKSVAKAVQYYTIKDNPPGLAVSYHNLALVYEEEREYDSSIALLLRAKDIWSKRPDNPNNAASRIYGCNNQLIRIYTKAKKMSEAEAMVKENEPVDGTKFHYTGQFNFYKEARDFYTKNKDKENANIYKDKYNEMREGLKAEGKKVD